MSYKLALRTGAAGIGLVAGVLLLLAIVAPRLVDGTLVRDQLRSHIAEWSGGEASLYGRTSVRSLFNLTLEAREVTIVKPQRFGFIRRLDAAKVTARLNWWRLLRGQIVFEKLWIDAPRFVLAPPSAAGTDSPSAKQDKAIAAAWPGGLGARANVRAWRAALDELGHSPFATVVIYNGEARWSDAERQETLWIIEARLELDDTPSAFTSRGKINWRGQTLNYRFRKGVSEQLGRGWKAPFRLAVDSPLGSIALRGALALPGESAQFTGSLEAETSDMNALSGWLGWHSPALDWVRSATLNAQAIWGGKALSLDQIKLDADDWHIEGVATITNLTTRPRLAGTLDLGDADLTNFFLEAVSARHQAGARKIVRAQQRRPEARAAEPDADTHLFVRLARLMGEMDMDLRVSTGRLTVGETALGPAAFAVSLKPGEMRVDLVELTAFEGTLRGTLRLVPVAQAGRESGGQVMRVSFEGKSEDLRMEALLAALGRQTLLGGAADMTFDLSGQGSTLDEAVLNAAGSLNLAMTDGGTLGYNLFAIAAQTASAGALAVDATAMSGSGAGFVDGAHSQKLKPDAEETVAMLSVAMTLQNTKITVSCLKAVRDGTELWGRGLADLRRGTLDWQFGARKSRSEANGNITDLVMTDMPDSFANLPVRFSVSGSWAKPQVHIIAPRRAARPRVQRSWLGSVFH